ncbi:DUF2207 domain-containing protein [Desulfovibrio sp. OttesenSCG-928-M16]|nr:DUF2207 domain-containing protein [Desulfovibrio sp. OttesenSCG-928-M16]
MYEIRYRSTDHVLFFEDRDEIYFNVTGNDWELPIDRVSFTFLVPGGVTNILKATAFTGAYGEAGTDFVMEGENVFKTIRPFAAGEGLTVAVAWKKGLITQPPQSNMDWMADHREICYLAVFLFLGLFYGLISLLKVKPKQSVVPLFSAPEGMSPGYMAALKERRYSGRMLHADMLWAAVNGFIRLEIKNKNITLYKHGPIKTDKEWIRDLCHGIRSRLFAGRKKCAFDTIEGKKQAGVAYSFLEGVYKKRLEGFWKSRRGIKIFGWCMMTLFMAIVTAGTDYPMRGDEFGMVTLLIFLIIMVASVWSGIALTRAALATNKSTLWRTVQLLIGPPLVVFGVVVGVWASQGDYFVYAAHGGMFVATVFCMNSLPIPSYTKAAMPDYLKMRGLEMYVSTAEKHRLAVLNAPEDTIEKYEELLPYAIALGHAEAWQKRFQDLLGAAYMPEWADIDEEKYDRKFLHRDIVAAAVTGTSMAVAAAACVSAERASRGRKFFGGSGFGASSSGSRTGGRTGGRSGGGSGGGGGGGW